MKVRLLESGEKEKVYKYYKFTHEIMKEITPVVVEFAVEGSDAKEYMIGSSLDEILKDAKGGETFGVKYKSPRIISLDEAKQCNLSHIKECYDAVLQGCKSYWLGTP